MDSLFANIDESTFDTSNPATSDQICRSTATYTPKHQRFIQKEKRFTQQFSHIYLHRLLSLKPIIAAQSSKQWPDARVFGKVIDLASGDTGVLVGTLYKEQKLKPCILDEFALELSGKEATARLDNYSSDDDSLVLEDESGRVVLTGLDVDVVDQLVTGVVVGIFGTLLETGELKVRGICEPGFAPQQPLTRPTDKPDKPRYILLASGLHMGGNQNPLPLQLLTDYIIGHAGNQQDHEKQAEIVRVVVAGDVVVPENDAKHFDDPILAKSQSVMTEPIKQADTVLSEWCSSVPVDVLPGTADPSSLTLPQQPLHRCLFPLASRFNTFRSVTNPYECDVEGVNLLGHAGQPISDCALYSRNLTRSQIMEATLKWRHVAPTAPDTLPAYPFYESDPFVLDTCPHLYFCGNSAKFESHTVAGDQGQQARVICIPKFASTGQVVLVDIDSPDLACSVVSFEVDESL